MLYSWAPGLDERELGTKITQRLVTTGTAHHDNKSKAFAEVPDLSSKPPSHYNLAKDDDDKSHLDDPDSWKDWHSHGDSQNHQRRDNFQLMFSKDPPPYFDGKNPETTWRKYTNCFQMWLKLTDLPPKQQGHKVLETLGGTASELVGWWPVEQLTAPDAAHKIYEKLFEAYDHLVNHDAHKDFEVAVYGLQRNRTVSLLDFSSGAIVAFAKCDKHGEPLQDLRKGMILLTKAKIKGYVEEQLMSMTEGKRELSGFLPRARQLARRHEGGSGGGNYPTYDYMEDDDYDYYYDEEEEDE